MHLFEYKLQRCLYKGTIVYIFQIVFCVCCMYSTWHTVMDTCTFTYYFIRQPYHPAAQDRLPTEAKQG